MNSMHTKCHISYRCVLNVCKNNGWCIASKCSEQTKLQIKDFVETGVADSSFVSYRPAEDVSDFLKPKPFAESDKPAKYVLDIFLPQMKVKKKKVSPEVPQTLPITVDNFFVSSYGIFDELNEVPEGFVKFFSSKGSQYYTNAEKDTLIRVSDHWGFNIRYCSWHLKGYKKIISWRWNKEHGKENRIGKILFSDLKINPAFNNGKKIIMETDKLESRHPF